MTSVPEKLVLFGTTTCVTEKIWTNIHGRLTCVPDKNW
jgi:hypothetical protein